ncbi:hypothetical protein C5167_019295 [Papaver somniferum]|uniref:Uncharacterized protein n=1 Tax=Papaver somniferum TaxID=3469 RepID=A0A4Y7IPS4_PAPSO|nr:hypothetical protein C5167_019295 [Papaver somniferum]
MSEHLGNLVAIYSSTPPLSTYLPHFGKVMRLISESHAQTVFIMVYLIALMMDLLLGNIPIYFLGGV